MALWRFGQGWPEETMKRYLAELAHRPVSFSTPPEEMTPENGWKVDGSEEQLGIEEPGPPVEDGVFARAKQGIVNFDFSDPRIVEGHFDPEQPLVGRNILLEIKVLGLRFLSGARVDSVREESDEQGTIFGYRYDTLSGHIEQGFEWFLLAKDHQTGTVSFRIEAHWRLGDFPNWWSRLGFQLIGEHYRTLWRHEAPERLRRLVRRPVAGPVAAPGHLAHRGDPVPQLTQPAESGRE